MSLLRVTFGQACVDTRTALDISRQALADRVGVSARYIALIERGQGNPTLGLVERIAEALGLSIDLAIRPPIFPSGQRTRDPVHARCSAYVDRRIRAFGWLTAREIEVVHGRSHGWVDLLAFDQRTGTLLVIEIKTRLDDLGALERQMAWYERMAWDAARRNGWDPRRVIGVVLALASDEVEHVTRAHRDLLRLAFPMRADDVTRLLHGPGTASSGRGIALIDPSSRRREPLIRLSIDGRRSALPYRRYGDAV